MRSIPIGLAALSLIASCGKGNGPTGGMVGRCTPAAGGHTAQFVMSQAKIPTDNVQFGIDLDGDGKRDNRLGSILGALTSKVDPQMAINNAIQEGTFAFLLELVSTDAKYQTDTCMVTHAQVGEFVSTGAKPLLDGTDQYRAKSGATVVAMSGALAQGAFSSQDPLTSTVPIEMQLSLPIAANAPPLDLHIVSAHLQLTVAEDGKTLRKGEVHGAIRQADVQGTVTPGLASIFGAALSDPKGTPATKKSIADLFDVGDVAADPACNTSCSKKDRCCKNPDNSCSQPGDGKIDLCEVSTQSAIVNILNPDVKLFDASGHYKPVAGAPAAEKDCLSLGLGFDAAAASFVPSAE